MSESIGAQEIPALPPPSLRARAPARISMVIRGGATPGVTRGWMRIRARQNLIVKAVAPTAESRIEFTHEPGLRQSVPPHRSGSGPLPEFSVEYTGDAFFKFIPWPRRTQLRIIVLDERMPEPFRMGIPLAIGPTLGAFFGSWALACLAILSIRWRDKIANLDSAFRFTQALVDDLPYVVSLAAIGIPIAILVHYCGWAYALSARGDEEVT